MAMKNYIIREFHIHLMHDEKPSLYFNEKEKEGLFKSGFPLTLLGALKKTEQNPVYHPEGNCWNHTMQVVDNASSYKDKSSEPEVLMWSALLHDIGKPSTTRFKKGKIVAYDHDKAGEKLALEFLEFYNNESNYKSMQQTDISGQEKRFLPAKASTERPAIQCSSPESEYPTPQDSGGIFEPDFKLKSEFIKKVSKMVRWHMQMLMVIKDLPFADIKTMQKEVDINEIALLAMCDRLGRGELTEEAISQERKNVQLFIEKCRV